MADALGKLLVVDDDDDLLQMTARRLRRKNYEVDLAHDLTEATALFSQGQDGYLAVICDLFLGNENGLTFFEHIQQKQFRGEFILATGDDAGDSRIERLREIPRFSCLQKPFELQILLDILQRPK